MMEEIARACLEDERILRIVRDVAAMSVKEREEFRRKVVDYFVGRTSEVDVEAYRFYKFILEDDNASRVLKEVEKLERSEG